jgi:DNA-binding MarR family transcriptional regulator
LLKRLAAGGLISRQRRLDDERSVEICLTDKGRRLREDATRIPPRMHQAIGPVDREALLAQLKALETNLRTI